jgi:hypothetical protein
MAKKLPTFNLAKIITLRQKLTDEVMLGDIGNKFSGQDFLELVSRIKEVLPKEVPESAISDSIKNILGVELSEKLAEDLAWRLAGNLPRLKKGIPVPVWTRQLEEEWAPIRVESVWPKTLKSKKPGIKTRSGAIIVFRFLAGFPAGKLVERFWSDVMVRHYRRTLGFSAFDANRYSYGGANGKLNLPLHDIREIGRFRFVAKVLKETFRDQPTFDARDIRCPPAFVKWNQTIQKRRQRVGFTCPYNLQIMCHHCPVGWEQCSAACHARNFVQVICSRCKKQSWSDPETMEGVCVDCRKELI